MRRRPFAPALLVAALAGAGAAPSAHAAWSPPQTLARPAAQRVAVAGDARGVEDFAWIVTSGRLIRTAGGQSGFASSVRARERAADGILGAPRTLSAATELVTGPSVALDAAGNATVVWTQSGRHQRIMGAFKPRGGLFGKPFEIGRSGVFFNARPQVAVDARGSAVIAWNAGRELRVLRRSSARCRGGRPRGCFAAPQRFAFGAEHTLALGRDGRAFLVWAVDVPDGSAVVHTRLRVAVASPARRFGHSQAVTTSGDAAQPSLAVTPDGSAILAWRGSQPAGGEQDFDATIFAAVRNPAGAISTPQAVSRPNVGYAPQVATTAGGEAILVWNERDQTSQNADGALVAAAVRPAAGGPFALPTTLSPAFATAGPASLAIDAGGITTVVYGAAPPQGRNSGGPAVGIAQRRAPGGASFGAPELLPPDFVGGFVVAAGARVTAVSGGVGGKTQISDVIG